MPLISFVTTGSRPAREDGRPTQVRIVFSADPGRDTPDWLGCSCAVKILVVVLTGHVP